MIRAGIIGGGGYTAGELIRILMNHPEAELTTVVSNSQAGKPVSSIHQDLAGETDLVFADKPSGKEDVLFLCMGHGQSKVYLEENMPGEHVRIIDLSQDFRHREKAQIGNRNFIFGLPEANHEAIRSAGNIANPGCFATSIMLALLPLAAEGRISEDVHIHGITGSTGAGQSPSATSHFSWRNNNISAYKVFTHQHLTEIRETLHAFSHHTGELIFIPIRGDFTRGIYVSAHTRFEGSQEEAVALYERFYKDQAFTHLSRDPVHLKQVVNTNKCLVHVQVHENTLLVTSIIDNLLKGASGQAVQNMNLMFGFPEQSGLMLKSSYF